MVIGLSLQNYLLEFAHLFSSLFDMLIDLLTYDILDELMGISIFLFNFMCLWWFNLMFCSINFLMVVGGSEASRLDTTSVEDKRIYKYIYYKKNLKGFL